MKQQANLIRAGQVIEHDGRRWTVLKQQIITPGKGGAFIQVEMRDLKTGNKTNERWRTADTVERLMTDNKEYTYSYTDGDNIVLMDPETFEQTIVPTVILGDQAPFLQDNMVIELDLVEGEPVGAHLPQMVTLEVVEADPVVKGQTASSSYKPAKLSNGGEDAGAAFCGSWRADRCAHRGWLLRRAREGVGLSPSAPYDHTMDTAPARDEAELERELRLVEEARADVRAGRLVPFEAVQDWIESIGTDHELPPPRAKPE